MPRFRFYLTRTSIHQAEMVIEARNGEAARTKMDGMIDNEELGLCVFLDTAEDFWEETSDQIEIMIAENIGTN